MRAAGLIYLGAGAGLIRDDLRDIRRTDISCRSGGVLVQIRGPRARTVRCWPATRTGCCRRGVRREHPDLRRH